MGGKGDKNNGDRYSNDVLSKHAADGYTPDDGRPIPVAGDRRSVACVHPQEGDDRHSEAYDRRSVAYPQAMDVLPVACLLHFPADARRAFHPRIHHAQESDFRQAYPPEGDHHSPAVYPLVIHALPAAYLPASDVPPAACLPHSPADG